jgi:uncharacterized membrane protein
MMWWGGNWSWAVWVAMTVTMLGLWALVVGAVVVFFRGPAAGRARDAEEITAERFARGAIDEVEFAQRRDRLRDRS